MPDLAATWDIPNPYGLLAGDFGHDVESYGIALKFLSDLAGGTPELDALKQNGGIPVMLRAWQTSEKFRRVLSKCRDAGAVEAKARSDRDSSSDGVDAATEGVGPFNQRFVPIDALPVTRSVHRVKSTPGTGFDLTS